MSLTNTVELAPSPPHIIGPTWQKTTEGKWHLPEKTLGWGILNWWAQYVRTPGGKHAGEAFMPTLEQARFTLWWYAVDENGEYTYREGCLRRLKGWGKDPFAAALSLVELCGPVAFSHFDDNGKPVGKTRHAAWVTVAAVSQDQTKNTFSLFPIMISDDLKTDYGLSVNRFIIYSGSGGRIEAATSAPASMEGNRPTFVVQNETQWWGVGPDGKVNDGHAMASVIEGNMTKVDGARTLSICNAHIPGTDSVAEVSYNSWQDIESGNAVDTGLLYDALEAPADTPISEIPSQKEDPDGYESGIEKLREGLLIARGDSDWLPIEDIIKSVLSTKNTITESRRKFLNQINASEDSWISPQEWNRVALTDPIFALQPKQRITLGFDGSKSNDWTALVACRVDDGMLFVLGIWDPEKYGGEVPRDDVDTAVHAAFAKYDVVAFRADVKEFEAYVDQWGRAYKKRLKVNASPNNPVAFDMRGQTKRFAFDCERLEDAILEREAFHDNNPVLRQHVLNAHRHPTTYDAISIRKATKDSSRKIDAAVCAVLAFGARQDYLMSKKARSGRVVMVR
ncbi:terminase [Gordonia phage Strosahl]|uniref:Terminase n=3 Tax=Soupsvirus TaxID=1982562 RepID=A0A1B3B139_9CAUD|nr:terminase large subunit [Gordonia phage Remus]YP_009596215.1 terminase large subunit [Gordonia phage Strosahl]YP_009624529.1 terminase large subunit [Gordonia phage Waits]AOE44627.1 terminase [Gordonia phage Remus]AOE44725.1 terminase [Gordonia phage Strosahl]AVO22045.1 terminase [Gordonia phage Waits]